MQFLTTIGISDALVRAQNTDFGKGKALRVIPRGKYRLTVYRAHQICFQQASQKVGKIDEKNKDISRSLNSFKF